MLPRAGGPAGGTSGQGLDRFASIEGGRALLALWVFSGHLLQQSGHDANALVWPLSVFRNPALAVSVFMIVSGFVISHLVLSAKEPYPVYIARRWLRLFPLLAVCILFMVAFTFLVSPKPYRFDMAYLGQYLAAYATMLNGAIPETLLPDAAKSILPPAWSISLEWQFYLVAPFLILLLHSGRAVLVVAILAALAFAASPLAKNFTEAFLPLSLGYFLLGMASYQLVTRAPRVEIPAVAVVLAALICFYVTERYELSAWVVMLGALLGAVRVRAVLEHPVLLYLGRISYSLYLVHLVVIMPVRRLLLEEHLGLQFGTWLHFAALFAIAVPVTLLVSTLTYRFIERPCIAFGRRLAARNSHPVGALPAPAR